MMVFNGFEEIVGQSGLGFSEDAERDPPLRIWRREAGIA